MELEDFLWLYNPRAKDLRARDETAFLCGVSDGRGKLCGRSLSPRSLFVPPEPDQNVVFMSCPNVMCRGSEFLVAMNEHRAALYFEAPSVDFYRPEA